MDCKCLVTLTVVSIGSLMAATIGSANLIDAVEKGDKATVRSLLADKTTDVNALRADGSSALEWAVDRDDVEMVDLLLGAKADVTITNRYGVVPLSKAAENGNAAILERLLNAGADPNFVPPSGETALMAAARNGKAVAVKTLLVHGANVKAVDSRGQTPIMWAAARDNADAIRMLVEFGGDVNVRTNHPAPDNVPKLLEAAKQGKIKEPEVFGVFGSPPPTGFTAFLFAVRAGSISATKALLEAGANVNDSLADGETALMVACFNAHWQLADFLLDKGANPNLATAGWNALHQTIQTRRHNLTGGPPSPIPTGNEDSIEVVKKMIAHGVDVNARMTKNGIKDGQRNRLNRLGATAFLVAAKGGDIEAMRVLLAAGANPKTPNVDGTTPLMVAAGLKIWNPGEDGGSLTSQEGEVLEAVKLCVEQGNDVNGANSDLETPLHGAAYRGVNTVVQYLVDKGAKLDAKDIRGYTPLLIANGLNYSSFYKQQPATANLLRQLMKEKGLSTEGQVASGTECLDCFVTHVSEIVAVFERDKRMEAEYSAEPSLTTAKPSSISLQPGMQPAASPLPSSR
jgi:uncharacterized protein